MKKVLIITYYWPPSGGAGVQRWLKFTKYLRDYGWEPVIYTPENPEAPAIDNSLEKDIPEGITVLKTKVWEPYSVYKRFVGRKKEDNIKAGFLSEKKNPSFAEKVSVWIRGNFFIPDARKFWIKPSVKYLTNYLKNNPVDAMVSTGPPHSMHMIALRIKKKMNIPWLADFRDPWTDIDFYNKLMLTSWADRKHKRLEQTVISGADKLVTINWNMAEEFRKLGAKNVDVVTNGYDPDDFNKVSAKPSDIFEIVHIGSMNKDRNSILFWEVLKELVVEDESFSDKLKINLIGQSDYTVFEQIEKQALINYVSNIDYKPHEELMLEASKASVLLLPLNKTHNAKGITPGKLYEYLALSRPILCIGPENGDAAIIINECKAGIVVNFNDKKKMKLALQKFYKDYGNGVAPNLIHNSVRLKYSRKKLTGNLVKLLEELVGN